MLLLVIVIVAVVLLAGAWLVKVKPARHGAVLQEVERFHRARTMTTSWSRQAASEQSPVVDAPPAE